MYTDDCDFESLNEYNRFVNLDNIEWHIIDYLAKSKSKYADYLWKILRYDTEDCLSMPSLSYEERIKLVCKNNGDATVARVFISPYVDDAWEEQTSHLHIYLTPIESINHLSSKVNVTFECIVHNKIVNIYGDASEYNDEANPVELRNGENVVPYKSRLTVMLKCVLAELNGKFVNGVGNLQFDKTMSPYAVANLKLFNNRKFIGYVVNLCTLVSGVSSNSMCGY